MNCFSTDQDPQTIPIDLLDESEYPAYLEQCSDLERTWLSKSGFEARNGNFCMIPDPLGQAAKLVAVVKDKASMWSLSHLPDKLPEAIFFIRSVTGEEQINKYSLGWGLGCYRFEQYRRNSSTNAVRRLVRPVSKLSNKTDALIHATMLVRDLVNLPTNDLLPSDLSLHMQKLAQTHDAEFSEIVGDELLEQNYPLIHAVGRASSNAPRLLELRWGSVQDPHICLVGKGVCFDSGGLDIKSATGMRLMKKDMGGAAHVMGIAQYIMRTALPVRLRVLIPAVENAIAGNAFRPGDIITSRNGKTIEIDNTDAEGRLILADALHEGCNDQPDLLIDFATLTGAARVALGTEVGVYFSNDQQIAWQLMNHSQKLEDPIWQLPLETGYRFELESHVADLVNSANGPYGGSIIAALFLQEFIAPTIAWAHFDIMAYNLRDRPGRPKGGEAMGLRSVCALLESRYQREGS